MTKEGENAYEVGLTVSVTVEGKNNYSRMLLPSTCQHSTSLHLHKTPLVGTIIIPIYG